MREDDPVATPESLSDRPVIVLSAHLGDAAFSCGYLLSQVSGVAPVTVMSLFTHGLHGTPTRTARAYLAKRNARQAPTLYNQRRTEDLLALRSINVTGIHFGIPDALFRGRPDRQVPKPVTTVVPELGVIYPTYRRHIMGGVVSALDEPLLDELEQRVLLASSEDSVILAPLGLSGHVDRVLANQLGWQLARERTVGYYADQPDAQKLEGHIPVPAGLEQLKFDVDQHAKAILLERYSTHTRAELGRRIPTLDEYVYLPAGL
jgi:LmbE family N-acetylglucosaminyl deacetylase